MDTKFDVIVVGGGPAGVAAAVSAADMGAKTLLIERLGVLGGMSTSGLLNVWCGSADSPFFNRIYAATARKEGRRKIFDIELLKALWVDEVTRAGVHVLLHALPTAVHVENGAIQSISVATKSAALTLSANIYIDSTGDGDIAEMAGVPYTKGREKDGLMQPVSLEFMVGGVDDSRAVYPGFGTHPDLDIAFDKAIERGELSRPLGHIILIPGWHKGTAAANMTNMTGVDGTDPFAFSAAELFTRRQIPDLVRFIRNNVPGYENCYLLASAATLGVRETRHFHGDYRITQEDIETNRHFPDWVVPYASFSFGNHNLTGHGKDAGNPPYNGKGYSIPYGCFLPQGINNLYLSGRNISGTHMAHSSFRVMPICIAGGEAVGIAAALAGNCTRSVSATAIQDVLKRRDKEQKES